MEESEALQEPELFTVNFTACRDEVERQEKPSWRSDRRSSLSQQSLSLSGRHCFPPSNSAHFFFGSTCWFLSIQAVGGDRPGRCCSWSERGCWRAASGGTGSSAGWRRSPSSKVWTAAHRSGASAPPTSGSTRRTCPPRSWEDTGEGRVWVCYVRAQMFLAAHLGSALRCRCCFRYHRKCCWGRKRATHSDSSCQHCGEGKNIHLMTNPQVWSYNHLWFCSPVSGSSCVASSDWSAWWADRTSHSGAPGVSGTLAKHSGLARCGNPQRETPPARWWRADRTEGKGAVKHLHQQGETQRPS